MPKRYYFIIYLIISPLLSAAQQNTLNSYNPVWTSQSVNSSESMPCGGGDIGLNVWVENDELLFYVAKSGTFDENNSLLKLGRVSVKMSPNPFRNGKFKQELELETGRLKITGNNTQLSAAVTIWVDVFNPVIHVELKSSKPAVAEFTFQSWRTADKSLKGKENNQNSWKWAPQGDIKTYKDSIFFEKNTVCFYHRNKTVTVFDAAVKQQGMEQIKDQLDNPLKDLIFGGMMTGKNFVSDATYFGKYLNTPYEGWRLKSISPATSQAMQLVLHTSHDGDVKDWSTALAAITAKTGNDKASAKLSLNWWRNYWKQSYIYIDSPKDSVEWQVARNYQLFRYMLACNAFGKWPTKFNGGLFTYDPILTDSTLNFGPDFRNWGGGTHTAQNQRLVYWPMLKSGDTEMMQSQFNFYKYTLKNAELRTRLYWNHAGASFTEQLENFGLPNPAEYGWKRPTDYDKGMEYNAWLEYEWDTVLEFCLMILEQERYTGNDISAYLPLIKSSLTFFDEHYRYLANQRGSKALNQDGQLVLYPGSGAETYKMTYNSSATIAGLKTVLSRLLELPDQYLDSAERNKWQHMLRSIPPISFREFGGKPTISPALAWERINNTEAPQLYPVYPWGIYGIGKPGLDTAINTFKYDADVLKFRSHTGWKQDNIFAARLGLTKEAAALTVLKLKDSGRRFPAFWGPGFDWVPDHNWGGSGMIGLQEMLMQTDGKKILLFPAWPTDWDTHFKLHAPYQTTIEGILKNGKLEMLHVTPESRKKDIQVLLH